MRYPAMDAADGVMRSGSLRVLASGSSGNCSVLVVPGKDRPRAMLIDAGLSPRRTLALMSRCGLEISDVGGVILTHLDTDHWNSGWVSAWPRGWLLWMSEKHAAYARRHRLAPQDSLRCFGEAAFEPEPGVAARPILASHDELGVASFRFDMARGGREGSLGFATDLGRVPEALVEGLRGVDVLAIESNYSPELQMASSRPWHLKQRIMGGHGHLSNEEAQRAIMEIGPREHVVLLHLSRECNDPGLVASMHEGSDYALTISDQFEPTRWVAVPSRERAHPRPAPAGQLDMFPAGAPLAG